MRDEEYMQMAIELALMARGRTSPNPNVGAVLVKDHRVIGLGAHLAAGLPHAEVHALRMAGVDAKGSSLYVTLEPCAHHGKTPPCADALIAAGVSRVHVAVQDPFVLVSGRGIKRLRDAGVDVTVGLLSEAAEIVHAPYLHCARKGRSFVTLKMAATLDGKIAAEGGGSMRITGEEAQREVHRLRDMVDAVAVGVGTVIEDNPLLTTRLPEGGRNPVRIVFDSRLRIPLSSQLLRDRTAPTLIFCTEEAGRGEEGQLRDCGVEVIRIPAKDRRVTIAHALEELARRGLQHVLLEGGSHLAGAFVAARCVDEMFFLHAPKLLGSGLSALTGSVARSPASAIELSDVRVRSLGQDVLTTGRPIYPIDEHEK